MKTPEQLQFQGSAESRGFAPITPTSSTAIVAQNVQALNNSLERNGELGSLNIEKKYRNVGKEWEVLANFSQTLGKKIEEIEKQTAEDIEIGQFYDVLMGGFENSPTGQQEQQAEQQAITEGTRQAEQVSRAANTIEQQTGNPVFAQVTRQQFGRLAAGIVGEKALLMQAQASYGSFLASWLESNNTFNLGGQQIPVAQAMASGDPSLVQAAVAAGRHQFIRANNLQYATKTQFVNILGNSMLNTEGQMAGAAVRSAIKSAREEQVNRLDGLGYDSARNANSSTIGGIFHNLSDQFFHSNTGLSRQQANEAAVKALIGGLEDAGNVDALEALLDTPQVPGQSGTELRTRYGNLINDAIERAHDRSDRYDDRAYNDVIDSLEANLNGASNAADRQQIIDSAADVLESRGLYRQARELRNNYQQLMVEGGSDLNAQEAAEAITNGEITSANQVNRLVTEGKITRDQGNTLLRQLEKEDLTKNPTFKSTLDQWQDSAEATFLSAIGLKRDPLGGYSVDPLSGDEKPLTTGQAAAVVGQMRRDMLAVATMYSRANPGLSDTQLNEGLNRALTGWIRDNLNSPNGKYRVDDIKQDNVQNEAAVGRIKGYVDSAHLNTPASLRTNQNVKQVDWSPSLRDNGGVTSTLAAQFRASRGDRLFTTQQVKQLREQVIAGQIPQALKQAADKLGRTPLALLNQQIEAAGMGESFLVNPQFENTPAQRPVGPAPTNGVSGAQLLMSRFGLPVRGAAWLAGNITTESKWNTQRSWDDVGQRAGGAASWRGDRLVALERHFGRPITQIPTNDQLSYLINDLKNNYPNQWRIFNNPNSTNRQLLNASYEYWRWGVQGDRQENAVQIEQSLRNGRTSRRQPTPRGGTPQQRAVNVGQQLLSMGTRMWQHPNFDLNNGYVQGGARVGGHSSTSHHYSNSALDIPLSHNNQAQLAKTFEYLRRNMVALGIVELFWDAKGYYKGGKSIGGAGSNAIPGHGTHIHVAFG